MWFLFIICSRLPHIFRIQIRLSRRLWIGGPQASFKMYCGARLIWFENCDSISAHYIHLRVLCDCTAWKYRPWKHIRVSRCKASLKCSHVVWNAKLIYYFNIICRLDRRPQHFFLWLYVMALCSSGHFCDISHLSSLKCGFLSFALGVNQMPFPIQFQWNYCAASCPPLSLLFWSVGPACRRAATENCSHARSHFCRMNWNNGSRSWIWVLVFGGCLFVFVRAPPCWKLACAHWEEVLCLDWPHLTEGALLGSTIWTCMQL